MLSSNTIVLTILGLSARLAVEICNGQDIRHKRSMRYHGPLAPINVPEVHQAEMANQAALAAELQRLKEAARLAAAHPDLTSPNYRVGSKGGQYDNKYKQPISQQYYSQTHLQAPLNLYGTVAKTAQQNAFMTEYKRLQEAERVAAAYPDFTSPSDGYNSYRKGNQNQQSADQYNQAKSYDYRQQNFIPAPLNKDGTVAMTPEVQQATAAHQAAFAAEFRRLDEAAKLAAAYPDLTSPQKGYSSFNQGYHNKNNAFQLMQYDQPAHRPAPLIQFNTAAVQNVAAAQQAAFAAEFKPTQRTVNIAAAHPDRTSPLTSYSSTKSQIQQQLSYAYNPLARIPAPLNPDGTVAHTAEYKAIAAAHRAEHVKALQRNKQHGYFPSSQQSLPNNYHGHY